MGVMHARPSPEHRGWGEKFAGRTIVHIDMDAFFAQVEALDNPEYRGRPLVVGGRRESARGVVSTCSYEARRYGIHSAMPIQRAVKLCPHAIFIPTRMDRYEEVSNLIFQRLQTLTPMVEPLSIDEAFLDMTGCEHFYDDALDLGRSVKSCIEDATGLTSSVGIAPNKFLAKLASEQQKPDGLTIVSSHDVDRFLMRLPVESLWGVGPKTAAKLRHVGVRGVADVRRKPLPELETLIGTALARHIYALAFGRDERPVEPDVEAKSMGRETTFETDVPDGPELHRYLARLCAEVGRRLRRQSLHARTLTVKIRYPDFESHTKSKSFDTPFHDDDTLYREARALLAAFRLRRPLRLIGVYVSSFTEPRQTSLFDDRDDPITDIADALNDRWGAQALRRGREL